MRRSALAALLAVAVVGGASAGQAATAYKSPPEDPWERFNRFGFQVGLLLDRVFIAPAAHLFRNLTPNPIGPMIHNLVVNLSEPDVFANDVLQGRFKRAATPAGRFLANSTIGFLGLVDVAGTHFGLLHHDNEFGTTLGRWGAGPGPYVYLPLMGPSTLRDMIGKGVDQLIDPIHFASYANRTEISIIRTVVGGLDTRIMKDSDLKALMEGAADPYASLRSVYLQHREGEVRGSDTPSLRDLPSFDDPSPPPAAPATAGATPVEDEPPPPPLDEPASAPPPPLDEPPAAVAGDAPKP